MAVKQNTDEDASDAGKANNGSKLGKTLPSGLKTMDSKKGNMGMGVDARIGDGNNDSASDVNDISENVTANCNEESGSAPVNLEPKPKPLMVQLQPFIKIQDVLDCLDKLPNILAGVHVNAIGDQIVYILTHVIVPHSSPQAMKKFKQQILQVGEFLSKDIYQEINMRSLHTIGDIITRLEDDSPTPSPAVAILLELFSKDLIIQFSDLMAANTQSDAHRRNFVRLLCHWLINCSFCTKLHIWIESFVAHYYKRPELYEHFANDNIDKLMGALIMPLLRPKVTRIIMTLLFHNTHSPMVFHRIIPRIPKTLRIIHAQALANNQYAQKTILILQQLNQLLPMLMLFFGGYDDLYAELSAALKGFNLADIHSEPPQMQQPLNNGHAGLVNLGNTCYMNSVLQALANTKEFSREILLSDCQSPVIVKLQEQIALLLYSDREELTPTRVLNATRPPGFCPGQQQDSSEFLNYLLETLHEQERAYHDQRRKALPPMNSCTGNSASDAEMCDDEDLEGGGDVFVDEKFDKSAPVDGCAGSKESAINDNVSSSQDKHESSAATYEASTTNANNKCNSVEGSVELSTIEKTFTGKQVTTYACLTCGAKSNVEDVFRDLQLAFPESENDCMSNYSVQDLLDFYCSTEKLDGENQYYCDGCKQLRDALRSVRIISPPKYLIITLKHFKYDHTQQTRAKLMHKVYHDEKVTVKICPADASNEKIALYDLYASVVHCGFSMDSGHYYTYASDASDKWFKFNDSIVTPSQSEELHNLEQPNTPYILFYQMSALSNATIDDAGQLASALASGVTDFKGSGEPQLIQIKSPGPLKLEELPKCLQDYVNRDNAAYANEQRGKRMHAFANRNHRRYEDWDDDDDGGGGSGRGGPRGNNLSSSPNNCGENILDTNCSHYIY